MTRPPEDESDVDVLESLANEQEDDDDDREDTMSGPALAYSASRDRVALHEQSDKDLLHAIRGGDEIALNEIIRRKTGPLIQLAYRIIGDAEEARDIVQVTFFRIWEHRDRFDARWSPNTWIYRICSNLAIDYLRSRRSKERKTEPVRLHLRDVAAAGADHDLRSLRGTEVMRIFLELAADLTEKQRLVFLLREVQDLSSKEVAGIVGCRESTVRNHLFNARKVLRKALVERYPEYAPQHSGGAA